MDKDKKKRNSYEDSKELALLNKYYDEGSFATLVAVWKTGQWISYGDSVAFCYNKKTCTLQYSFGHISDFNNPPYLVNCKDATNELGFRCGQFDLCEDTIVFAASDALAHYILMMYEVSHLDWFGDELMEAVMAKTKNTNLIKTAIALKLKSEDFDNALMKILELKHKGHFKQHLRKKYREGLIGIDDYSLAIL